MTSGLVKPRVVGRTGWIHRLRLAGTFLLTRRVWKGERREVDREVVRDDKSWCHWIAAKEDFLVEVVLRRGCGGMGSGSALCARL